MNLPRSVRLAIRRLHHNFGSHKPRSVMLRLLRAARVGPDMLRGAMLYRCEQCAELQRPDRVAPAALPAPYEFNHEVLLDVFEEKDASGALHQFLSIIDNGTTFHVVCHIGMGTGQPSSRRCLSMFLSRWVSWAGWPKIVGTDRELHNRGALSHALSHHGVYQRQAPLENPETIGNRRLEKRCESSAL